jgi:hypothetical protein
MKKNIHIASFTYNNDILLAPIYNFEIDKFYLFVELNSQIDFPKENIVNSLSNSVKDVLIINCQSNYTSIYETLERLINEETDNGHNIIINISSGTRIFSSVASVLSNVFDIELFYVESKHYYIEREFSSGIEKIIKLPPAKIPKKIEVNSTLCFIAMPFTDELQPIFEDIVKPTVEENNLKCIRADDFFHPKPIMDDIWQSIERSRFILADLTSKNPNVFYEVGIAHALGKEVVLISQSLEDVPFDLRHIRCIIYSNTHRGVEKLRTTLDKFINNVIKTTMIE